MIPITTSTLEQTGTSYEIGRARAGFVKTIPPLLRLHTAGMPGFDAAAVREANALLAEWCPGLEQELAGFADGLGVSAGQLAYYGMTYLRPCCSQLGLPPRLTQNGHPLLARSYEFNHEMEDFCLVRTSAEGRYTHLGTSVMGFGRDEGINEHGLAVAMSSCGMPVGPQPGMRPPRVKGLQYWAAVRSVLENCSTTAEALDWLRDMPIAFNLNMVVMDKSGDGALVESIDNVKAVQRLGADAPWLYAANHACVTPHKQKQPRVMRHSAQRQWATEAWMQGREGIGVEALKDMLLAPYPNGPACQYYKDFFGTTKSIVMDPAEASLELCWGGLAQNGWRKYRADTPLENGVHPAVLELQPMPRELMDLVEQ